MLVYEKENGPREASEASRSNIPWSINSSENHAFLFIVVLDVISEEFRCGLPNELLFAAYLVVVI